MLKHDLIIKELLLECYDDHVGLWAIIWVFREELQVADLGERRRMTMEIVRYMLGTGLVQAGFPTSDSTGFNPWDTSPTETIARIESEWDKLGHEPNIGDIVWFTAKDEHAVEKISKLREKLGRAPTIDDIDWFDKYFKG